MWKRIIAYIELVKPLNNSKSTLYYGFCAFIGSLLAGSWGMPVVASLAVAVAITLSAFAVYALNDICDVEIDKINDQKRPLPSGRVTMREAKILTVALFAAALSLAYVVNIWAFTFTLIFSFLGIAYSVPPLRFKDGLFANIIWGIGIGTAIIGGASVGEVNIHAIAAAFTMAFLTAGCGFTKDLKDLKGDRALNIHTLPIILGEKKAIKVMTAASALGFPLFFLDVLSADTNVAYVATIAAAIAVFAISLQVLRKTPATKASYKKGYKLQATAGFLITIAFVVNALI